MKKLMLKNKYISIILLIFCFSIYYTFPVYQSDNSCSCLDGGNENSSLYECVNVCIKGMLKSKPDFLKLKQKNQSTGGGNGMPLLLAQRGGLTGGSFRKYSSMTLLFFIEACSLLSLIIILFIMSSDGKKRIKSISD